MTHIVDTSSGALTSTGGAFSIVVPAPPNAMPGNFLLCALGFQATRNSTSGYNGTYGVIHTPVGWTRELLIENYPGGGPNGQSLYIFYKFLEEGESGWAFSVYGRNYPIDFVVGAFAGVDPTTPIDDSASSANTPASTNSVAPSVTSTVANDLLVSAWVFPPDPVLGFVNTPFATPPGSMTERAAVANNGPFEPGGGLLLADQNIAAIGATGTRTATVTNALESVAASVLLKHDQTEPQATDNPLDIDVLYGIDQVTQTLVPQTIDDFLIHPTDVSTRVVVELHPYQDGTVRTDRFATKEVSTVPGAPGGVREVLFADGLSIERSIFSGRTLGGRGTVSIGGAQLANGDGALDFFGSLAWSWRDARLLIGGTTANSRVVPWSDYYEFAVVKTVSVTPLSEKVEVVFEDGSSVLGAKVNPLTGKRIPGGRFVQQRRYLGTGGNEGGADLAGVPVPIGLGLCLNVQPRLLHKTPTYRWQFHDGEKGAAREFIALYDEGIEIDSSLYDVDLANGWVDINTNPAGTVTCDFVGPEDAGDTAPSIARWLVSDVGVGPLSFPDDFAQDYFLAYEASEVYEIGLFLRDEISIADALDLVVAPLGYWVWSRSGKIVFGLISIPFGEVDLELVYNETGSAGNVYTLDPQPVDKPAAQIALGYARNWTVMDSNSLAGSAQGSERGAFAVEEYRTVYFPTGGPSEDVLEVYPTAEVLPVVPTLLVHEDEAAELSERYFEIYGQPWVFYRAHTNLQGLTTDVGRKQMLSSDRFELSGGQTVMILSMTDTPDGVDMLLWGVRPPVVMVYQDATEVMEFDIDDEVMQY